VVLTNLTELFDTYAYKRVSKTDKDKQALVVSKDMARVLDAAGILRSDVQPHPRFTVHIIDDTERSVEADYYASMRKSDPSRKPEPRMGLQLIREWLNAGDHLLLGNIGQEIVAKRLVGEEELDRQLESLNKIGKAKGIGRIDERDLRERVMRSPSGPIARISEQAVYSPNPDVVLLTLIRADGRCEMPDCGTSPFKKPDGTPYLNVHFITPFSQGGEDKFENAAGLCPNCRCELQYGADGNRKSRALAHKIRQIEREYDE
jgi:hypothetical protein